MSAGHTLPWTELNPSIMAADVLQSGGRSVPFASPTIIEKKSVPLPLLVQGTIGAPAPIGSWRRCVAVSTDQSAGLTIKAGHVGHPTMGPQIAGS